MANIFEQAKETFEKIKDGVTDFIQMDKGEVIQEFKDATKEKANSILEEITNLSEHMTKSGFELIEINTSLGLPPAFSLTYHFVNEVSEEDRKNILEENKDKKITTVILKTLFKSTAFAQSLKLFMHQINFINLILVSLFPRLRARLSQTSTVPGISVRLRVPALISR